VKKSETSAAYYEIVEEEAAIVREVYRWYTEEALSIGQIYRRLNALGVETRRGNPRGTGRLCGPCSVTLPTRERRVLVKRSIRRGKRSHAFCVSAAVFLPAAVVPVNASGGMD